MKFPIEVWVMVGVLVIPITLVQTLHTMQHSDYCKTEAQWNRLNRD